MAAPKGTTHVDNTGPSNTKWLRINEFTHDYWCGVQKRWITFEGGHNKIRSHWEGVMREIEYVASDDTGACYTKCPMGKKAFVASVRCQECGLFVKDDSEANIVTCNANEKGDE